MSFSVPYKELFRVQFIHHYFLDKGSYDFSGMTTIEQQEMLRNYHVHDFFRIVPTSLTRQELDGHKMVFYPSGQGFSVYVRVEPDQVTRPFIEPDDDLLLTFAIQITDPAFFNYTRLDPEHSWKLFYFSNRRPPDESPLFPLIPLQGGDAPVDESFMLSSTGAAAVMNKLPVSLHNYLFGVMAISMKGEHASHDVTGAHGDILETPAVFQLEFFNRKTIWRYIFDQDQTIIPADDVEAENGDPRVLVTRSEKPLTRQGFVAVELGGVELPNPGITLIKPDTNTTRIFSEIYM